MIALDTSVILAMALGEPESPQSSLLIRKEPILIGWPTLLETRMVLTGKGFPNASAIVDRLAELPNVTVLISTES